MIELREVSKHYRSIWALRSISLHVSQGERIAVVGPSGGGKSTLLRVIAGLETLTTGEIRIGDRDVAKVPPYQRGVALVSQHAALFPHWNVRQNLALGLANARLSKAEQHRRVSDMAHRLEITDLLDRRPTGLSGGQQKRVSLGRALVAESQVLLLDEPFSSLDSNLRFNLSAEVSQILTDTPRSSILVTHDVQEAMSFGTRLVVLIDGLIAQAGQVDTVYLRPATLTVARFLGDPPCSILQATLEASEGGPRLTFDGEERTAIPVSPGETRFPGLSNVSPGAWWVGVRPEHVSLSSEQPRGGPTGSLCVPARVRQVVMRGPGKLVDLTLGSSLLRAWTTTNAVWSTGDLVFAVFDPGKLLFYEKNRETLAEIRSVG